MTRNRKRLFALVTCLLWLPVFAMSLELFARVKSRSIEHPNAGLPPHPGWNPRPPVMRDAGPTPGSANTQTIQSFPEEPDHLGTLFATLTDADRDAYALLNDALLLLCNEEGRIVSAYGPPEVAQRFCITSADALGKPLAAVCAGAGRGVADALKRTLETRKADGFDYQLSDPRGNVHVAVACFPVAGPEPHVLCSFRDITSLSMTEVLAQDHEASKDPLWKTPWLEYRKNAVVRGVRWTNNVGFWGDDVALPKPRGVYRIVCVGGSTTMEGAGETRRAYPDVLQRKLREYFHDASIEVVNCGVGGLDSLGERRRALDYMRLQPDLLVHYNFVNDACHGLFPMWENDATRWQKALRQSQFVTRCCNAWILPSRTEMSRQLDRSTFHNLQMLLDCAKSKDVNVALCSFACPEYEELSSAEKDYFQCILTTDWQGRHVSFRSYCRLVDLYNEKVRALCSQQGLLFIPVAEQLKGGTNYFTDICHMQQDGIDLKADIVFNAIKDRVRK